MALRTSKTVRVEGLKELEAALAELPKATARNTLRRTLTRAATPIADTARQLAPDNSETEGMDLKSSIAVGTKLSRNQAREAQKAIRKGEGEKYFAEVHAGAGPVPHAHMQEFGTEHHGAQPFLRPAWDKHKEEALETIRRELGGEIMKAAKRHAKKLARAAAKAAR